MAITTGQSGASATSPTTAVTSAPSTATPGIARGRGLTGPGAVVLGIGVTGSGVGLDLLVGGELGLLSSITFLLTCALVAVTVRPRALLTAVALPPLLFVGSAALAAKVDGRVSGARELGLDVATTLALSAPVLFAGTAAAALIALVRAVLSLLHR